MFPDFFEPFFCGLKNPSKFLPNFPQNFPAKIKKIHRRASAGAQGEQTDYMQLLLALGNSFHNYIIKSLAKLILENCKSSCGEPL